MVFGIKIFNNLIANKIYGSSVRIDEQRCKSLNMYCGSPCENICPGSAISGEESHIELEKCRNCGGCTVACPIGATSFIDMNETTLMDIILKAVKESKYIKFVCENCEHPKEVSDFGFKKVKVSCLARLYSGLILMPVALGAKVVWLDTEICKGCTDNKSNNLLPLVEKNIKEARYWLDFIESNEGNIYSGVSYKDILDNENLNNINSNGGMNRRELFGHINQELKNKTIPLVNELRMNIWENAKIYQQDKKERQEPPLKRYINILVLKNFKREKSLPQKLDEYYEPKIYDGCTLCNICSKTCPTGAISKTVDKEGKAGRIQYKASDCINCGVCKDKCPEGVISYNENITFSDFLNSYSRTIFENELTQCVQCKGQYVKSLGQDNLCHICYEKIAKRSII